MVLKLAPKTKGMDRISGIFIDIHNPIGYPVNFYRSRIFGIEKYRSATLSFFPFFLLTPEISRRFTEMIKF